jgi:hypothetical protein
MVNIWPEGIPLQKSSKDDSSVYNMYIYMYVIISVQHVHLHVHDHQCTTCTFVCTWSSVYNMYIYMYVIISVQHVHLHVHGERRFGVWCFYLPLISIYDSNLSLDDIVLVIAQAVWPITCNTGCLQSPCKAPGNKVHKCNFVLRTWS